MKNQNNIEENAYIFLAIYIAKKQLASQNHRITQIGSDLNDHVVSIPCYGQGWHP